MRIGFGNVHGVLAHAAGLRQASLIRRWLRTRGFDGTFHTLTTFRTTFADALGFLVLLAATIALVLWDRLGLS